MRSILALVLLVPAVAFAQDDDDALDAPPPQQYQGQPPPGYQQQPPPGYQQQPPPGYQQQPPPQYADQPPPQYADQPPPVDPSTGQAYGVGYMGPHPIPYQYGNGYCYIQGAHSHEYAPFDQYLFREYNGFYYFVGDPTDFGYNRPMYYFSGNHPVPLAYGSGYCYIDWPHRHHYSPIGIPGYSLVGGYYRWGGGWGPDYWRWRDHYHGYYGGYYRTNYYGNRYYTVRPRAIYAPAAPIRIAAPAGRTFVGAPPARVSVGVGYRPGVVVGAPRPGVVVGAPRPAMVAPAPRPVVVGAPAPRPVVVGAPRPAVVAPAPARRVVAPAPVVRPAPRGFRR